MKLFIEQSEGLKEPEISVRYDVIDNRLEKILGYIRLNVFSLHGVKDGEKSVISLEDVYYFDSTDERTFAYLENDVYECSMKLYELERQLSATAPDLTLAQVRQAVSTMFRLNYISPYTHRPKSVLLPMDPLQKQIFDLIHTI